MRTFGLLLALMLFAVTTVTAVDAQVVSSDFHTMPYLQRPEPGAMSIRWMSRSDAPGEVRLWRIGGSKQDSMRQVTEPQQVSALAMSSDEAVAAQLSPAWPAPWRHHVRFEGLQASQRYGYVVKQGNQERSGVFRTPPRRDERRAIKLAVFADSETEPESTGKPSPWAALGDLRGDRKYLVDQTAGLVANLKSIRDFAPELMLIAGDLVESGGEQRDWSEFWLRFTDGDALTSGVAGNSVLLPALGNHEYFAGPQLGRYSQPGSEDAVARYLAYFDLPDNEAPHPSHRGRYYRTDYGPITIIVLDVNNGAPQGNEADTNYYLLGEGDIGGPDNGKGGAPNFLPGSRQYQWLEAQLKDAQKTAAFTFVVLHQCPYSSGPHGRPAGVLKGQDPLSGRPVQRIVPLMIEYGVDAIFSGHDEMYEHSIIVGAEFLGEGDARSAEGRPHRLHVFDVGIAGDGLRGPDPEVENPHRRFIAHHHDHETWAGNQLLRGGKHYGHLQIVVMPTENDGWRAELTPVYLIPRVVSGRPTTFDLMKYNDRVELTYTPSK